MLDFQKLVGSGPVQPVRWLCLCTQLIFFNRSELEFIKHFRIKRVQIHVDVKIHLNAYNILKQSNA